MTLCPHCRLDSEAAPKIHSDVTGGCLKSRQSLCLACQKLLEIEKKIEETHQTLSELLNQREQLASAVNEHHDPFVNQLPVEIISHIFALSRPYLPSLLIFSVEEFNKQKNIRGVLNPGQVCRNWRTIAHRTPELWTVFGITIEMNPCVSSVQLSLEWLRRSGGFPLFIWLRADDPINGDVSPSAREFLASVAQHTHRWKVLDFGGPIEITSILRSVTTEKSWERLEHILLDVRIEDENGSFTVDLPVAPLWLTVNFCQLPHLIIDWRKLTRFSGFHLYDCCVTECIHLFKNALNLLVCDIGMVSHNFSRSTQVQLRALQDTPVTHSSLRTLHIGTCFTNLWDYFNFPSLSELRLGDTCEPRAWTSLRSFLRRSNCIITDLYVLGYPGPQESEILDTLKLTTHVERLGIQGFEVVGCLLPEINNLIQFGNPEQFSVEFLPKLKALIFHQSQEAFPKFNWSSLNTFIVASTSKGRRKLESVEIHYDGYTLYNREDELIDRNTLKKVLDCTRGLEFRMVGKAGLDLVESLRCRYNL